MDGFLGSSLFNSFISSSISFTLSSGNSLISFLITFPSGVVSTSIFLSSPSSSFIISICLLDGFSLDSSCCLISFSISLILFLGKSVISSLIIVPSDFVSTNISFSFPSSSISLIIFFPGIIVLGSSLANFLTSSSIVLISSSGKSVIFVFITLPSGFLSINIFSSLPSLSLFISICLDGFLGSSLFNSFTSSSISFTLSSGNSLKSFLITFPSGVVSTSISFSLPSSSFIISICLLDGFSLDSSCCLISFSISLILFLGKSVISSLIIVPSDFVSTNISFSFPSSSISLIIFFPGIIVLGSSLANFLTSSSIVLISSSGKSVIFVFITLPSGFLSINIFSSLPSLSLFISICLDGFLGSSLFNSFTSSSISFTLSSGNSFKSIFLTSPSLFVSTNIFFSFPSLSLIISIDLIGLFISSFSSLPLNSKFSLNISN